MTGNPIQWQDWGEQAFRASEDSQKPVLLTLGATWCHWCHVMDETSYSDPRIVELVNSSFIPVRVDVDHRPDVSRRYNQGGYPSLAILDHDGRLITGRIYTPPDTLLPILQQVSEEYPSNVGASPSVDDSVSVGARQESSDSGGDSPVARVLERLQELEDPEYGGFGDEPKQPSWEAIGFLLARYSLTGDTRLVGMFTEALDGILAGLYDQRDQGFFRYSVSRDWKVPHYEKMLLTNAGLATACLEADQATGRGHYREAALGATDYLFRALYDRETGLFYASQDAGEEYYRLPWKDRTPDLAPSIDKTFYTDWNAAAASALIKAYDVFGVDTYLKAAVRVLDRIWNPPGVGRTPDRGLQHVVGAASQQHRYLVDQVQAARAFLDLHQSTGDPVCLERAVELARISRELFGVPGGGFCDVFQEPGSSGPEPRRELPLLENSWHAETLIKLSLLTGEPDYLEQARRTLEPFKGMAPGGSYIGPPGSRRMEEDEEALFLPAGSAWGRAWDMLESGPVHMALVGEASELATRRLLRAASQAYAPHKVLEQLSPSRNRDRISDLGFPTGGAPALYVCMNGVCLAPLVWPSDVRQLGKSRPWANHLAGGQ
jgi:uncharacterized protein YyaL (SSP411 family)